jgi:hypothetical protein
MSAPVSPATNISVAFDGGGLWSYIRRHWRGELSLPQSYWVNGVIVGWPVNIYVQVISAFFKSHPPESPAPYIFLFLIPLVAVQPLYVWQGVGVWRSAGHRIARGMNGWAWAARTVVILDAVVLILFVINTGRLNYAVIQSYILEQNAKFEVEKTGNYVTFRGTITKAAVDEAEPLLKEKDTEEVVINGSNGGFVGPTLRFANIIAARGLRVVVWRECFSGCTALLAAGSVRAIGPYAAIGLHRATLAGLDFKSETWNELKDYYIADGASLTFLAKVESHAGPYDMYEPTLHELIDNGLVTAIADPGSRKYTPASQWCRTYRLCHNTGRQNAAIASIRIVP